MALCRDAPKTHNRKNEMNSNENQKPSDKPQEQASLASATCSAADVAKHLSDVRAKVRPTRRGIMICGQVMAEMLRLGWHKQQLGSLEILFWSVRDADGRVKPPNKQLTEHGQMPGLSKL